MDFSRLQLANTNRTIHIGPCALLGVTMSGDGAAGDCDIYDGTNAFAERKAHLETLTGLTAPMPLTFPVRMDYGIFVAVNAATTFVMIEYAPLDK